MSDETGDQPAPDRLSPDADPIFVDEDEPEIPEAADLPPSPDTEHEAIGPPAGLSSARDLRPGEFHRPPPDLSSLPSVASYQPPVIDTGDDEEAADPAIQQEEPVVAGGTEHPSEPVDGGTGGEAMVEPGEPAGLSSARDLKPGEFHRLPPQLSSLPSVAPYQPSELDPVDDGMAEFVEPTASPEGITIGIAPTAEPRPDERVALADPTPPPPVEPDVAELDGSEATEPAQSDDAEPTHSPESTADEARRRGFDELPVYPPVPRADAAAPDPAAAAAAAGRDGRPQPIDPGPPPPPPRIPVGPPPPPPGTPYVPTAATSPGPPGTIEPPPDGTDGPDLPVRDAPPAPPPIRTEIPARPAPARAPTAPLPVVAPPPVVAGHNRPPPPSPPRPQPELTMEDLIAASMAQNEGSDSVNWLTDAEAGRSRGKGRWIGVIVGVAAVVAVLLGIGAFLRHAEPGTSSEPGTNESALLAVDPDGSPEAPYGIGDWAEIGGGWWLSVADAEVEAEAVLQDSADFNPTPRNGGYAMAGLDLRYLGTEPTTLFDLSFDAVAPSGRTHSSFDCRATEPHPLDRRVDVFPGAALSGDECFDVAVADRASLVLAVSSGPGSEPTHFSLTARGSAETSPPEPPAAAEPTPTGSRGAPVPLGEAADIGGGWLLRVDHVTKNAEKDLVAGNLFNEPPVNGAYALADVTAVYTGPGETDALDVRFNAVGPHNVGYSSAGCAAAEPQPFPWANSVLSGGELAGQVCFDIDPADMDGLTLYARGTPDAPPVFFSAEG